MADTHETITDIIAEMRRGTKLPGYWRSCDVNKILQYHADRLDAAHKREARGNSVALREALDEILERIDAWRTDGSMEHWQYSQLFDIADAALAAPPRNCDRFATADESIGAYRQTHKHMVVNVFLDWLFAPATEKEGGGK